MRPYPRLRTLPASRIWARLVRALSGGIEQRITRRGLAFVAAALIVGVGAFASANNLLFLLLSAMLATLLVSGFVSRLSLAGLELDFEMPEHVSARRRTAARVRLRNSKGMLASFSIRLAGSEYTAMVAPVYFPLIPSRMTLTEDVDVYFARRGMHSENSFWFSTRFPFGFTDRRVQVSLRRDVLVYPCLDPQPGFEDLLRAVTGEISSPMRGRGHDFHRIRPYEYLESARHVDWRATAHTGELQVREFAREQDHVVEIILDLIVGTGQEEWFEWAVDATAFLVWRLASRGIRLRLASQEFDRFIPNEGDVYSILKYLALVAPGASDRTIALHDENSVQLVFTLEPQRFENSGWSAARFITPDSLAAASAAANLLRGT